RRSRRSPRHLRVSGQRRRRYRDERYPTQSPMPLTVACASPEMASGKVWIRYPIVRPQETQVEEQREPELALPQPVVAEPQVIAAAEAFEPETPVQEVENESVAVEPQVADESRAPEAVDFETTHPEVIAAPVDEQPQLIAESDTPIAQAVI
ncbi:ribonuclease E, partial [Salmonella enterica subsp. arizonae]|nr:ribonuclease E [Salmonella enterica subsp. arizonae]